MKAEYRPYAIFTDRQIAELQRIFNDDSPRFMQFISRVEMNVRATLHEKQFGDGLTDSQRKKKLEKVEHAAMRLISALSDLAIDPEKAYTDEEAGRIDPTTAGYIEQGKTGLIFALYSDLRRLKSGASKGADMVSRFPQAPRATFTQRVHRDFDRNIVGNYQIYTGQLPSTTIEGEFYQAMAVFYEAANIHVDSVQARLRQAVKWHKQFQGKD